MNSVKVEFFRSAFHVDQFPDRDLPEVAFAGRSNVGKSSLINTLLGRKQVARVSATPGRTQSINFYLVDEGWFFADLPGYGFAKVPPSMRIAWQKLIESYLVGRQPLQGVVLIVDVRRDPMDLDLQLKEFLEAHEIPILVVATKVDKLSKQQVDRQVSAIAKAMKIPKDAIIRFSSETKAGRLELWKEIYSLMEEGARRMKEVRKAKLEQGGKEGSSGGPADEAPRVVITSDEGEF